MGFSWEHSANDHNHVIINLNHCTLHDMYIILYCQHYYELWIIKRFYDLWPWILHDLYESYTVNIAFWALNHQEILRLLTPECDSRHWVSGRGRRGFLKFVIIFVFVIVVMELLVAWFQCTPATLICNRSLTL